MNKVTLWEYFITVEPEDLPTFRRYQGAGGFHGELKRLGLLGWELAAWNGRTRVYKRQLREPEQTTDAVSV